MSIAMPLRPAALPTPGPGHEVPTRPPMTPKMKVVFTLVLEEDAAGALSVRFDGVDPTVPGEKSLTMHIYCDTLVRFELDKSNGSDWEFDRNKRGIYLGQRKDGDERYYNLKALPPNVPPGRPCLAVEFEASYYRQTAPKSANSDPYGLRFLVYKTPSGNVPAKPEFEVDPDIKNPGDDGLY